MTHAFTLCNGDGETRAKENISLNLLEKWSSPVENKINITTEIQLTLPDEESSIRNPESVTTPYK